LRRRISPPHRHHPRPLDVAHHRPARVASAHSHALRVLHLQ
jgi:hypothetical protein